MCNSFQERVVSVLVKKTMRAISEYNVKNLVLAGGVAANSYLRERLQLRGKQEGIEIYVPSLKLCTDNAAMIASLGYFNLMNDVGLSDVDLDAVSNIEI